MPTESLVVIIKPGGAGAQLRGNQELNEVDAGCQEVAGQEINVRLIRREEDS